MTGIEAKDKVNTICWVGNLALMTYSRYKEILDQENLFKCIFPNVRFENPTIKHNLTGEKDDQTIFTTTKAEVINSQNYDLYKGCQIISSITGMTSVFEYYLKSVADRITRKNNPIAGIFYERFKDMTKINMVDFNAFVELRKYYEVRNISVHNLGVINQRFKNKTAQQHLTELPYVYYPIDIIKYNILILSAIDYIEAKTCTL